MTICPKCKGEVPANEAASYHGFHETCAVEDLPPDRDRPLSRYRALPSHAYQTGALRREWRRLSANLQGQDYDR